MTVLSISILPSPCNRILTIIAHPDDAESFAGGTMALFAKESKVIDYLVITHGDKGNDDQVMSPDTLAILRKQEQQAA